MSEIEYVILVDGQGQAVGTAPKNGFHTTETPRHLAFSCYVFNQAYDLLLTRRALGKVAWPGVWSNSCCGHPAPGESISSAVHRRTREELGIRLTNLVCVLPEYSYSAIDSSGIVENEFCPVFAAISDEIPRPNPREVTDYAYVSWDVATDLARNAPQLISPWAVEQIQLLSVASGFPPKPAS